MNFFFLSRLKCPYETAVELAALCLQGTLIFSGNYLLMLLLSCQQMSVCSMPGTVLCCGGINEYGMVSVSNKSVVPGGLYVHTACSVFPSGIEACRRQAHGEYADEGEQGNYNTEWRSAEVQRGPSRLVSGGAVQAAREVNPI